MAVREQIKQLAKPADPTTPAAGCTVLPAAARIASYFAARGAVKVDPIEALNE